MEITAAYLNCTLKRSPAPSSTDKMLDLFRSVGSTDFADLDEVPDKVQTTVRTATANAVHLARLLAGDPYLSVA